MAAFFMAREGVFPWLLLTIIGGALTIGACSPASPQAGAAPETSTTQTPTGDFAASGAWLSENPAAASGTDKTAAAFNEEDQFFCYVEVLKADRPSVYGYQAPRGCIPTGEFQQGERAVFRIVILDRTTGKEVTPKEAESVTMRFPFGVEVPAEYKQRGEGRIADAPWTWDVCWDVPLDYPLGVLDYSIIIKTRDGRTGVWKPPALVDPVRGIDTRPQIIGRPSELKDAS